MCVYEQTSYYIVQPLYHCPGTSTVHQHDNKRTTTRTTRAETQRSRAMACPCEHITAEVRREVKAAEETKDEQYRSHYPGSLHFDYAWDQKKARAIGLEVIWRDDKFTYLRGRFQETPALYEVKDGKPSLVNFDFAGGLYTVPKQISHGYLTIGKKKVDFDQAGEAR